MRLPYLQVTQETWGKARELAGLLGINRHAAMGVVLDLWAWGMDLGNADEAPTGELTSPNALKRLAGALEFPGLQATALADALQDIGLIDWCTDGELQTVRVRGMDRYAAAWDKRKSDRERAAVGRTSQRSRSDVATTSGGKTQTQTHIKNKEKPPPPSPSESKPEVVEAKEIDEFLSLWESTAQHPAEGVPVQLGAVLAEKRAQYGPDVYDVMRATVEAFHDDDTLHSHALDTFILPSVLNRRMAEAHRSLTKHQKASFKL